MKSPKLPILGQPIFVINEYNLSEKVTIAGEFGFTNNLVYFAADGILVKKLEYEDDSMKRVIINKGMHLEGDDSKDLEIRIDLTKDIPEETATIFVDEVEAQAKAKKMNENQKKSCKKLVDAIAKSYNEYDNIIAACSVK